MVARITTKESFWHISTNIELTRNTATREAALFVEHARLHLMSYSN
jgi:hypothetical protein